MLFLFCFHLFSLVLKLLALNLGSSLHNCNVLRLFGSLREMLAEYTLYIYTNSDEATSFDLMIAQIKNFRLLNLREHSARIVRLEISVGGHGVLVLHLIVWVIQAAIDALETSLA